MEKSYQPAEIEKHWYRHWEESGYFAPAGGKCPPYCIMLPPPNVTGSLHMGHAFQQSLIDILIRYHRMRGFDTLWQGGTDHAGIATQMVVERQLEQRGQSREGLGRDDFIAAVWQWKQESGDQITRQSRHLGSSIDWQRSRFTMDTGMSAAVTRVFVQLYEKKLIYRGKRLVNWDPVLHTAISDLEVVNTEENGFLWHIRYPLTDGSGSVTVATTRPETLLGDAAVAVHPEDERYRHLVGQTVQLPLTGRAIPVIADEYVDAEYGSGCVKITPAHDFNDWQVGVRHHLEAINIFTESACINDNAPADYRGMDRYQARKKIVADLDTAGLLEKTQPHKMMVPRGDRSQAVTEPRLTDQWYLRVAPLAERAITAVETGQIRFVPENWSRTYFDWMRNLEDWCISRQLWWGHRIPAWYGENDKIYVGVNEEEVRSHHQIPSAVDLRQDEDVLDTWFSSALWPFSALGWPQQAEELQRYYPGAVLVTGFDIIFFWVARMIMMGLECMDDVPFKNVYVHGLVRDHQGQKMSKSKGNILDPIDLIEGIDLEGLVKKRMQGLMQPHLAAGIEKHTREQYPDGIVACGTDSLRFTFAALATPGRDIRFDTGRIQGYRNFCNKLWNAVRYIDMTVKNTTDHGNGEREPGLAEQWILTLLAETIQKVDKNLSEYRFDLMAQELYEFCWNAYCDWYVEFSKLLLNDTTAPVARQRAGRQTLLQVMEVLLRLLHPVMPFITEELWQKIAPLVDIRGDSLMNQPWPNSADLPQYPESLVTMEWLKGIIMGVRKLRSERNISPKKKLSLQIMNGTTEEWQWLEEQKDLICHLAGISHIDGIKQEADAAATTIAGT